MAATPSDTSLKLTPVERHVAHIAALSGQSLRADELMDFSRQSAWTDSGGKRLTAKAARAAANSLVRKKVLRKESYGSVAIDPVIQDLVVQDSIREDWFDVLIDVVQRKKPNVWYGSHRGTQTRRDLRIAFYKGDVAEFKSLAGSGNSPSAAGLLSPFSQDIYDQLDPILQEMYLVDVVPQLILEGSSSRDALDAFQRFVDSQRSLSDKLTACAIDVYFASGSLGSLSALDQQTNSKLAEIAGCEALLRGEHQRAESCFAAAMPIGKRGARKSKTALKHLPGLLYLLLLLKKNSPESRGQALSLASSISRARDGKYAPVVEVLKKGVDFQQTPSSPADFAKELKQGAVSPLSKLLAGYVWRWSLTDGDIEFNVGGLADGSKAYDRLGMSWLAAELAGLAGKTPLKSAPHLASNSRAIHQQLGTQSLVDAVRAVPVWERALNAISQLGSASEAPRADAPQAQSNERMIWELCYSTRHNTIHLTPIIQKRTSKGWTKGRRVSLQRLYDRHNDAEFGFLTEQDIAVCRALQCETSRNYYGYNEDIYYFDDLRAARAIIGHPCVFAEGSREIPFEIVEKEPHLMVARTKGGNVAVSLQPAPTQRDVRREQDLRILKEGPQRLAIVVFNKQHLMLSDILGGELLVPESAAGRVMDSIQSAASLVAVHSEIGAGGTAAQTVAAQSRPHLHLLPCDSGLQLEFYVRPFGDEGPFFRPGEGAETVVAKIDGQTQTARRQLKDEAAQQADVLAACPTIAAQAGSEKICLPSAVEALETLLELETLVAERRIVLHWPQGRHLNLAGQAADSQFRLNIRKDRDWFAASGELQVDDSLSLELMKLMELVEASPTRFVQLDDGRFLALTEQLRRRIKDMAAFGQRGKGKLRLHPISAAALEDLDQAVQLKADKHWRQCLQRMRDASELCAETPSTLLTELRDYQHEGFQWLARLAHWGVGACLADDMGLGKTIQALALLLLRAADGPALIVAPTSVAFNWHNEILRFAPTLNVRQFGPGDRQAVLQGLGPRDVVLCSYGLMHSEAERLQSQSWHTVVLDEAQAIKNTATKRSQAAMGLDADFRLIMTGTPLENHLGELWNLFQFINPGLLGSWDSFQRRFAAPIERDGCRETRRRLKRLIQPFILRRTKTQVLQELPPRTEITLKVELSAEEAAFYEALRRRAVEKLADADDGRPQHVRILAELMRLRRACCHPRLLMEDCDISSSKLALFSETLSELLDNKHKVLVFSQFVDHLTVIREELERQRVSYQYLDGGTPPAQRKRRVEAFQSGEGDVFLISLKAGGLGLNLTAADYVIHMDPWWNPAVEDQASDRAHRLGQQRPVTIYRLITQGTIEERITELHATKRDLADSLLEGADTTGKLSVEELLQLLRE